MSPVSLEGGGGGGLRDAQEPTVLAVPMLSPSTAPAALPDAPSNDELLRRIDQQTTMTFHWVRLGVIVTIILLLLILIGF